MTRSVFTHRVHGYQDDAYTFYPVVIIGAGMSGIAMGCRLKQKLGFDQFRIFDRQSGIGGTWWIHRYPGAACDIPASLYSFSFAQNPCWTTLKPSHREIVEYLEQVCEKCCIADKFRLNTEVREIRWLEEIEEWEVTLTHLIPGTGDLTVRERQEKVHAEGDGAIYQASEKIRAKIVISGAGKLVQPNLWPKDIPSIDKFEGDLIHTARWNNKVDLNGKDVVVIGSGCSAAQVVPQLVKPPFNARSVTQVMRSPPWVEPNALSPDNLDRWEKYMPWLLQNIPFLARALRLIFFCIAEVSFILIFSQLPFSEFRQANYKKRLLKHMRNSVPDKYHKMLTPNYNVGCKRRVYDVEWFRSLQHPNVKLTALPLRSVEQKSVTLGSGPSTLDGEMTRDDVKLRADTIILANGYRVTSWLHPLSVKGRGGKDLGELWSERGGVQAYLGVAVDKFPNFFLIFGPNTSNGHTSVLLAIENAVNYSLKFIKPILDGEVISYEVREEAVTAWTSKIQKALKNSVWMTGGCHSWYKTEDGWNATTYPFSQFDAYYRATFPVWSDWSVKYSIHGILKKRTRSVNRLVLISILVLSVFTGLSSLVALGCSAGDILECLSAKAQLGVVYFSSFLGP